MGVNQIAATA